MKPGNQTKSRCQFLIDEVKKAIFPSLADAGFFIRKQKET